MNRVRRALLKATWLHVAFAFCVMGSWGFFANAAHPLPHPLVAGIIQGVMSALLTLFLKQSVDWLRPRFSIGVGYWVPPLIASLVSISFLGSVHFVFGTPEVLKTIAVPISVSVTYIFTYNVLRQNKHKENRYD